MVTANAVKVMESNNFQEFQNYREGEITFLCDSLPLLWCVIMGTLTIVIPFQEAHQTSEFFSWENIEFKAVITAPFSYAAYLLYRF